MDVILFLAFAAIAVVCAVNVVVQTHPISSALSLVGVMGSLAVLYLLLGAEFIAMAQVIVYAGAIMVLFIFVIMLLNAGAKPSAAGRWRRNCSASPYSSDCCRCSASPSCACSRMRRPCISADSPADRRATSARRCSRDTCCRLK